MLYRIADFNIDIEPRSQRLLEMCEPYRCDTAAEADFVVRTSDQDIRDEKSRDTQSGGEQPRPAFYEQISVYRKICAYALAHDAFLMHCAVIEYEGRGYAFSAPSGTGKTTHIKLWQQVFGEDKVTIVNGDKPILRALDGEIYAYGTPWSGKEGYNANTRVPLRGLCFLERGAENSIRRITPEEAVPYLFGQIMISDSTNLSRQMELVDLLLQKVPCYRLACNMNAEAAHVAYSGMKK